MTLKLNGETDGSVSINAPADTSPTGTDITLTLPTTTGSANQFVKNGGTAGELEYSSMVETSTGVGISTTSPGYPLEVAGQIETSGSNNAILFDGASSTPTIGAGIHKPADDTLAFVTASNERARLDGSGRLLFNTTSNLGGHLVQVKNGDVSLTKLAEASGGNAVDMLRFRVHNSNNTSQDASLAGISAETVSSWGGCLTFHTKPANGSPNETVTERTRIDSSGRFLHGLTSPSSSTLKFEVAANVGPDPAFRFNQTATSGISYDMFFTKTGYAPDNTSSRFLTCSDTSATRLIIRSDGDVINHDNSYGAISDVSLKQQIVDASSQWDDIKDVRVRKFKMNSDVEAYGDEAGFRIGVIAQELEQTSPGLVKDHTELDGTILKSVSYSVLYMKAIKALQEAQTRIETLETQHADLLARVTALEAAE